MLHRVPPNGQCPLRNSTEAEIGITSRPSRRSVTARDTTKQLVMRHSRRLSPTARHTSMFPTMVRMIKDTSTSQRRAVGNMVPQALGHWLSQEEMFIHCHFTFTFTIRHFLAGLLCIKGSIVPDVGAVNFLGKKKNKWVFLKTQVFNVWLSSHIWLFRLESSQLIAARFLDQRQHVSFRPGQVFSTAALLLICGTVGMAAATGPQQPGGSEPGCCSLGMTEGEQGWTPNPHLRWGRDAVCIVDDGDVELHWGPGGVNEGSGFVRACGSDEEPDSEFWKTEVSVVSIDGMVVLQLQCANEKVTAEPLRV
ncbi:hypothetical protein EYF80_002914 [Liparis tanakae]|uniref:Uncharacterized protein n=1 Tax=Liparis tanakae TaxID=230148 RepID=A0A4Z2J9Y0_9TELE|nr:hypothetical protein EYF80_002914 [Liparis tanakae]